MFKLWSNFIPATDFFNGMNDTPEYGDFYFVGNEDLKYKSISVFNDHPPHIPHHITVNKLNILMIMEPNQLFGLHDWAIQNAHNFDLVLGWGEEMLEKIPNMALLPFGISWLDKEYVDSVDTRMKNFEVSFLCGGKKRIEGHFLRHRLYERGEEIQIPKKWFYTLPDYDFNEGNHTVGDMHGKKVVWNESMYSICIENSSNKNYHTEKIIDAFLSKTVPIYWGCPNLEELGYDPRGFIYCNNEDEIIQAVNALTPEDYESRREAIEHNYEVAKYYGNFFNRFRNFLTELCEANKIPDDEFASQEGEDKWIVNNLNLPEKGVFLDIGACYPVIISNTYHFEKYLGWTGLAIEPDPVYYKEFAANRSCITENVAILPDVTEMWFKSRNHLILEGEGDFKVKCARLDDLLNKHNVTKIDLISIDVEGFEEQVWSTFNYKKYDPEVMIVEHTEMGAFNDAFAKNLLKDLDYEVVHATPLNYIIAKKGLRK